MRECNDKVMKSSEFNTHWGGREFFFEQIDMYVGGNNSSPGAHANERNMKGWRLHVRIHHQHYFCPCICQDNYCSYQGWLTFPVSMKESIPQWNGTDVRQEENIIHMKSQSKKRAAPTEKDKSVVKAPKRVATEELDGVDGNQNVHSSDPKDLEGGTDEVNYVQESEIYGNREEQDGDRSDKEAAQSKALDAERNTVLVGEKFDIDSEESSEGEGNSQRSNVSPEEVGKLTVAAAAQNMPPKTSGKAPAKSGKAAKAVTKGDKKKRNGNKAFDSEENMEDEEDTHTRDDSEEEVATLTVPGAVSLVDEENPRSGSQQVVEGTSKPRRGKKGSQKEKEPCRGSVEDPESDYEVEGDDPQWTDERRQNRILRYEQRLQLQATPTPLHEREGNKEFIKEFDEWAHTKYRRPGTAATYSANLFRRHDGHSLLTLMTHHHGPAFCLNSLAFFIPKAGSEQVYVPPLEVATFIFADDDSNEDFSATIQQSLLKSYIALIRFLVKKATAIVPQTIGESHMRGVRIDLLKKIHEEADELWPELNRRIDSHSGKSKAAKKVLDPNIEQSITNLVHSWNESEEYTTLTEELFAMHRKYAGKSKEKMTEKEYERFVKNVHGLTGLQNAGRAGQAGSIKVKEYDARKKIPGVGASITLPPEEGRYNKTGNTQTFFIDAGHLEFVDMYVDIKYNFFAGKDLEESVHQDDAWLFCSAKGNPIKAGRHSFMEKVSSGSSVPNVTQNTVRAAASTNLLMNPETAKHESQAMDHHYNTARKYYDKSTEEVTVKLKKFLAEVNGNRPMPADFLASRTDVLEMRQERERIAKEKAVEAAKAYTKASKQHQLNKVGLAKVVSLILSNVLMISWN